MKRIALLVVYLGEIPNYIHLFLKSCEYQKNIDFFLKKHLHFPESCVIITKLWHDSDETRGCCL